MNKSVPTAGEPTVPDRDATVAPASGGVIDEDLRSFWYQPAAGQETLNAIAVPGARIWLVTLAAGWLWVLFRAHQPGALEAFTVLLLIVAALSSRCINFSAKSRLGGLAAVIALVAETAFLNNRDMTVGTLHLMPAAVVITIAFGMRWGVIWLTVINGAFFLQAHIF